MIDVETLEDVVTYGSARELLTNLNPSMAKTLEDLTTPQAKSLVDRLVGPYLNVQRPKLTESGTLYYCRPR